MKFRQALQVGHNNVTQIMALPCIFRCEKLYGGRYEFGFRWGGTESRVHEGDWIVERALSWETYTDEEWEARR